MPDVLGFFQRGQHDYRQRRQPLVQFADQVESTHARQCKVQQHQVEVRILSSERQALLGIARGHDGDVIREGFQSC